MCVLLLSKYKIDRDRINSELLNFFPLKKYNSSLSHPWTRAAAELQKVDIFLVSSSCVCVYDKPLVDVILSILGDGMNSIFSWCSESSNVCIGFCVLR